MGLGDSLCICVGRGDWAVQAEEKGEVVREAGAAARVAAIAGAGRAVMVEAIKGVKSARASAVGERARGAVMDPVRRVARLAVMIVCECKCTTRASCLLTRRFSMVWGQRSL